MGPSVGPRPRGLAPLREATRAKLFTAGALPSAMRDWSVSAPTGGTLQAREVGDPNGVPVFALHGTPGCRLWPASFAADARSQRIRLVSYDRAGYGSSTAVPGRRIVDVAQEVAAIADDLGVDRFGVWGVSGGGAPALGVAAALPRRVVGAASLAGVAPFGAAGLDWLAGMGELNVEDFQLLLRDPVAWEEKTRRDRDQLVAARPEELAELWSSLLSEVDRAGLTEELSAWLVESLRVGLANGHEGMRDDGLSEVRPWGFDPAEIRVPVQIWHGAHDRFVPFAHGRWLASHVPGAEAHLLPNEGHLTLFVNRLPEVHRWLGARSSDGRPTP